MYDGKEDIAIAVNGAANTVKKYDVFMSGDRKATSRDWWIVSQQQEEVIRLISSYVAPFDEKLYPQHDDRVLLQERLAQFEQKTIVSQEDSGLKNAHAYVYFVPDKQPVKPHAYFRFGGFGLPFVQDINKEQDALYWGGTIAGIALQTANIMGGKDIHIYGCTFMNATGKNYFYTCSDDQKGSINDEQVMIMQASIDKIRTQGVKITIHGESAVQ